MEIQYKGYKANLSFAHEDISDILNGYMVKAVVVIECPNLRCSHATLSEDDMDLIEDVFIDMFHRAVDSKK